MMKVMVLFLIVIIVGYLIPETVKKEAFNKTILGVKKTQDKTSDQVSVSINGKLEQINMDDYLLGVVAGEMPVSFELEALKAQVVAARTFVYARNLTVDNTTHSQVFLTKAQMKKNWQNNYDSYVKKIKQAIKETDQMVMKYDGNYISAMFFSSSNGHTENSEDYFVSEIPYLRSVDCPWDQKLDPNYYRSKTFTINELKRIFSCKSIDFTILSHKKSGRVDQLMIDNKTYSGREVRELLGLASSDFTIERTDNGYTFTTQGSGHGVGMSQYGAQGMALEGKTYQEILNYFYTGVEIVKN